MTSVSYSNIFRVLRTTVIKISSFSIIIILLLLVSHERIESGKEFQTGGSAGFWLGGLMPPLPPEAKKILKRDTREEG